MTTRVGTKTAAYLLRLSPEAKAELEDMAARADMTLADALREGARTLLIQRLEAA